MNKLNSKQISEINARLTDNESPVINLNILDSIINVIYEKDERNFYIYKDSVAKAAKLACEIYKMKPFEKKNLSSAVYSSIMLLQINGIKLFDYQNDISDFMESIKNNDVSQTEMWIRAHFTDKYATIND